MQDLPRYEFKNTVQAFKIATIVGCADASALLLSDETFQTFRAVSVDYLAKHVPVAGGYYVKYDEGYESFSPAEEFELGHVFFSALPPPPETATVANVADPAEPQT